MACSIILPRWPTHSITCWMPLLCSSRNWCATNGSPWIGISDLGMFFVSGPRRVARPPASMTTGSMDVLRMRQNRSPAEIKLQPDLAQPSPSHSGAKAGFVFCVEHQKASAACANQFAAQRTIGAGQLIHFVDQAAADSRRAFLLVLPVNVHEFGKLAEIARQQRVPACVAEVFGMVQILQHLAGVVASSRDRKSTRL